MWKRRAWGGRWGRDDELAADVSVRRVIGGASTVGGGGCDSFADRGLEQRLVLGAWFGSVGFIALGWKVRFGGGGHSGVDG